MTVAILQGSVCAEDRRIAVVNVSEVFSRFDRVKAVQADLEERYSPQQKKLQADERELRTWKERWEQTEKPMEAKGSRRILEQEQKLQQAAFDLQTKYEKLVEEVEKRRKDEMQSILTEIKRVIGIIGKQEKFDLVLRAPEYAGEFDPARAGGRRDDDAMTSSELVRRFRDNPVLYFAPGTEITDLVIDRLNKDNKVTLPPAPAAIAPIPPGK
jgi:Skp family chaperone for outer membrane proteins